MKKYVVKVDNNYHSSISSDGSDIYEAGSFDNLEEAIEKCKQIVVSSLGNLYEEGITSEQLSANWLMFGEDPFVYTGKVGVPFSAREFVTDELCKDIIKKK